MTCGTGKTQFMIDQLVQAVAAGQPKCAVVGHSHHYAMQHLKPRVRDALRAAGLSIVQTGDERKILVEGSEIWFLNDEDLGRWSEGREGYGTFVDHWVDEEPRFVPREFGYRVRRMMREEDWKKWYEGKWQ